MKKKLFCLILGIIMLFNISACSSGKNNGKKVPVFVENDIGKVLGITSINQIKMNSKNQMVVYSQDNNVNKYITFDQNGKKLDEITCDFKGDGSQFDLDSEDNIIILFQKAVLDNKAYRYTENSRRLYCYNSKGEKLKDIDLGKETAQKGEDVYVSGMAVDSKGNIYLAKNNNNFEVLDSNGKAVKNNYTGKYSFIEVDDKDNIIAGTLNSSFNGSKPFIEKVDTSKWKSIWKKELEVGVFIKSIYYNKSDNYIYALTDKGINRYDSKGNYLVTVLDFLKNKLLKNGRNMMNLAVDDKNSIYILYSDNDGSSIQFGLKKFEVGKEGAKTNNKQTTVEKKVLHLSAFFADQWLQAAVCNFEAFHPDIEVNIKDYKVAAMPGDTRESYLKRRDDYAKLMNTEIMAGTAPDIILFSDDLPYRKYIDKNVFCNLSDMIEKDKSFNINELNTNVLNGMKYKGSLYTIPMNYQIPVLVANKDILKKESIKIDDSTWTWEDLLNISKKVAKDTNKDGETDQFAFVAPGSTGMFSDMFEQKYDRLIDKDKRKANFSGDEFINMLKLGKAFNDKKITFKAEDYNKQIEMTSRGAIVFEDRNIPSYYTLKYTADSGFNGDVDFLRYPSLNKGKNTGGEFYPSYMFSISSNSKYTEEAWAFIKFLLSKDEQSSPDLQNGLPINNEALKVSEKSNLDMGVPKDYIDKINKLIADAKVYPYMDGNIRKVVSEEKEKYFSGEKVLEDVIKTIQDKVSTYLGE